MIDWILFTSISLLIIFYYIANAVAPFGTDTLAYHLVVPRDVIWNHGYIHNYFAYQAGMNLGWQMIGVYAYLLGGARAVTCLVPWSLLILLFLIGGLCNYSKQSSRVAMLTTLFVVVIIISRNDRSGNDLPLVTAEVATLILLSRRIFLSGNSKIFILGILAGFCCSIKINGYFLLPFCLLFYLYKSKLKNFYSIILHYGLPSLIIGFLWPAVTFYYTGSPLPQLMLALRTQGPPLPQIADNLLYDANFWSKTSAAETFNSQMLYIFVFIIVGLVALLVFNSLKKIRLLYHFLLFASIQTTFLCGYSVIYIFRPRYILLFYLTISLISAILLSYLADHGNKLIRYAVIVFFIMFTTTGICHSGAFRDLSYYLNDFLLPNEIRTSHVGTFTFINKNLPQNAVLAGPAIETFYSGRKYLQIQGISQEQIDLNQPPDTILKELMLRGVNYIHFTDAFDLPPWMYAKANAWLYNFNKIEQSPSLQLVFEEQDVFDDHVARETYSRVYMILY
ncbi:MAG: hypothetical protein HQK81_14910 [Desulfovibrionaceae bacterium]|nr:hypothetical protein [Desulfovibrionaceae bacterium]